MVVSASYLTTLLGNAAGASQNSSLLSALYGIGGRQINAFGQNPVTALNAAEQNQTRDIKTTAAQPEVKRAVDAFNTAVGKATSVTQLLKDPKVMQVLLTANGLADQIPYQALAQKALQSNLNDPKSLANKLTDTRWKSVVQTYDFANKGLSVIKNPSVMATIANAYAEVTWRHSLDAATPGLSNALAFRKSAGSIRSVDQILGDPVLRDVVTTTLGLPVQIAFQPLEAQEKAISTRLDITKFKDSKYVESFVQRYLMAKHTSASTNSAFNQDTTSLSSQVTGLVV